MEKLSFADFAKKYCENKLTTPARLHALLAAQKDRYAPTGWFMAECQDMSSSRLGDRTIMVYGPDNSFKEIPTGVFSPRGLASDMSSAVAYTLAEDFPVVCPPWKPQGDPPEATTKKRKKVTRKEDLPQDVVIMAARHAEVSDSVSIGYNGVLVTYDDKTKGYRYFHESILKPQEPRTSLLPPATLPAECTIIALVYSDGSVVAPPTKEPACV